MGGIGDSLHMFHMYICTMLQFNSFMRPEWLLERGLGKLKRCWHSATVASFKLAWKSTHRLAPSGDTSNERISVCLCFRRVEWRWIKMFHFWLAASRQTAAAWAPFLTVLLLLIYAPFDLLIFQWTNFALDVNADTAVWIRGPSQHPALQHFCSSLDGAISP